MVGVDEVTDSRFKQQHADPRFQSVPKSKRKVKIDDRFKAMLDSNSSFGRKSITDKYGRKVKHEIKEDLGQFYDIDDEEEEEDVKTKEGKGKEIQKSKSQKGKVPKVNGSNASEMSKTKGKTKKKTEDDVPTETKVKKNGATFDPVSAKLKHQDLRTAMLDWASSSSDDENEDEYDSGEEAAAQQAVDIAEPLVPVTGTVKSGEETKRLAVLNMDWSRVTAVDILMLLRSFAPSTGEVLSVKVYPSEFGKERMEAERKRGPGEFLGTAQDAEDEEDEDDEDGDGEEKQIDMIKLRKYEAEKLKYYYAVAECDSARTAMGVYSQCDGVEYEASANVLDLRYIPDEEEFDDTPHGEASEAPADYASPFFQNHALGHTNVQLTWDQDDPRREVLRGKGLSGGKGKRGKREKQQTEIDYTPFLASSDSEGSGGEEERERARSLLLEAGRTTDAFGSKGEAKDDDTDMVVTFTPGLATLGEKLAEKKAKREEEAGMTVWEKYQQKRAEKQKEKRLKRRGGEAEEEDDGLYGDDGELPEGSEFVDDSVFADDPFFQLPEEEDQRERGMWKKKKGPRGGGGGGGEEEAKEEEEKERQRAQLELLMMDEEGGKRGYSIKPTALGRASERAGADAEDGKKKKKKKKGKKGKRADSDGEEAEGEGGFAVDVKDERFASVFSDPRFALDPTDPQFGKSPGLRRLLDEGRERREEQGKRKAGKRERGGVPEKEAGREAKKGKLNPELAGLVATLKARRR